MGICVSLVPVGVPVTLGVGKDVVVSSCDLECVSAPVLLGVSDLLVGLLPWLYQSTCGAFLLGALHRGREAVDLLP